MGVELSTADDKWSLTERPGWLRLHAFKPLQADNLMKAGNTLTQRCFRTSSNEVVIKLDLSGMTDGQKCWIVPLRGYSLVPRRESGRRNAHP